jgi:hypothetical protein
MSWSGEIMLNDSQLTIVHLYDRGYRVSEDGVFTNYKGEVRSVKLKSNHKYPQSQVIIDGKKMNYHIHRLAAYCFYGDKMFEEGIHVRHLNGNVLDVSKNNIALGTPSENEQDKPKVMRVRNARKATSCRKDKRRLSMRRFSDDEVEDIKRRLAKKENNAQIARDYGVTKDTIY